ncbi:MAG: hypothetical protein EAZ61_03705 [Oscillatoriales cyanobacterium]|nr:MAG: hypothetical protein EAZ61_03705 [Oscillatoriales cyanobacterium]
MVGWEEGGADAFNQYRDRRALGKGASSTDRVNRGRFASAKRGLNLFSGSRIAFDLDRLNHN